MQCRTLLFALLTFAITTGRGVTSSGLCRTRASSSTGEIECSVTTRENEPVNTTIINFAREKDFIRTFSTGFTVKLEQDRLSARYLRIDGNALKVAEPIDRESVCDSDARSECSIRLWATAASSDPRNKQYALVVITVTVEDVNEPPRFQVPSDSINVDESMQVGSNLTYRYRVIDDDSTRIGVQDSTGTFRMLQSLRNVIVLKLHRPLDYETTKFYVLNVSACDGSSQCAWLNLTVIVNDVNDNDPEFGVFANHTVTIPDSTERGSQIAQVVASDRDSGVNGVVSYAFENLKFGLPFDIDPMTGIITTTAALNIRERDQYKMIVIAIDGGSPQRTGTATINVNLVDANDHDPTIVADQSERMSVPEETAPLSVGRFTVSDGDIGENSRTRCQVESMYNFNLTELRRWGVPYSTKYELRLLEKIDYDSLQNDEVSVTITCNDHGSPQRSAIATFEVEVLPKNEHPPRFVQDFFRFSVIENHQPSDIGAIRAIDVDRNSPLSYHLRSAHGMTDNATIDEYFEMESSSGLLRLRKPIDRETHANFTFLVIAVDGGVANQAGVGFTATASVLVEVSDENDNAPTCIESVFNVPENREAWHTVGQIGAIDLDGDPLRFSLATEYDDLFGRYFEINQTGFVFTREQLDRENRSEFRVKIAVGDGHFVTQCIILIQVADVNDNAPTWPVSEYQFNVSVNLASGSPIVELAAIDADNSTALTYRFKSKYPDFLGLDQTGKLYLVRDLHESDRREYLLTVEACDADFRHSTAQDIRLLIAGEKIGMVDGVTSIYGREAPTLMWNLLISIIIIVTTITISCLLIVAILFLRKRMRKQALIAREREQLRRSLQVATANKIKGSNPLNNPVMLSSAYGVQQMKRPATDFIVHQNIDHEPDCALVEHLKWISNSQLLDPSSFYAKAPTPDYNTLTSNSKYSTFVKYSPEGIYSDQMQIIPNQLSGTMMNNGNNNVNGVTSSHSASSTEASNTTGNGIGNAQPPLNVRTNLNDTNSTRSNSNNAENHFLPPELGFLPTSKIAPASSESKLSTGTASGVGNGTMSRGIPYKCDANQMMVQPNGTLCNWAVHNNTMPKKRPHTAMNQPLYGAVFANANGAQQHACELHTFLPSNRMQPEGAVEVIDRAMHDAVAFNNNDQNMVMENCDLPDWYRAHSNHHLSPSSPYAAHTHMRMQMHSPYGIYSDGRVLQTGTGVAGTIINAQHQPMIPVKELEGDEV